MNYNNSIKNISPFFNEISLQKSENIPQNEDNILAFSENNNIQYQNLNKKIKFDEETQIPFFLKNILNALNSFINKAPQKKEYIVTDKNTGEKYKLTEEKEQNLITSTITDIESEKILQSSQKLFYDNNNLEREETIQYLDNGETIQEINHYMSDGTKYKDKYIYTDENGKDEYIYNFYTSGNEHPTSTKIKKDNNIVEYNYQEDGSIDHKDLYKLSDNGNILYHRRIDQNGNMNQLSSSSYDNDGSFQTQKHFISPDGIETNYAYKKNNDGSSTLIYNITDKDGKVLMDTKRTYEKISDNEAISTYNDKKYKITINDSIITVNNLSEGGGTKIDLDLLIEDSEKNITLRKDENSLIVSSDNEDFKEMIKQQPGDVLINMSKELNKIGKINIDNGMYSPIMETIVSNSEEYIFNHELGHAIDDIPTSKMTSAQISNTEEFLKVFNEEKEQFLKTASDSQIDTAEYLLDSVEFAAEAKMLNTTNSISERAEIIQEYFPQSIMYINLLMDNIDKVETRKIA